MSKINLSMEVWPNMPWGRLEICGVAVNSWGKSPLDELVHKVADHGYDTMDIVYGKIQEIRPENYEASIKKVKAAMKERNVKIGYIAQHSTLVTPRWWERDAGVETFKRAVDAAVDLGAETVCTLPAQGFYDPALYNIMTREEAWSMLMGSIKEIAEYAKEKNMTVSIEILQGTLINSVDEYLRMYEEVGMDNIFCTVDTGTFYTTVRPFMPIKEAIKKLGKHINVVHVKDEVGFTNIIQCQHVWYGAGYVDFSEMAEALKEIGYTGNGSVEWEGWQNGGLAGVGDPGGIGLTDFDMVASEAKSFLETKGWN